MANEKELKDDFGRKWKKKDYLMALVIILGILFVIILVPYLWMSGTHLVAKTFNLDFDKILLPSTIIAICVWFVGMVIFTLKKNRRLSHNVWFYGNPKRISQIFPKMRRTFRTQL